MITSFEVGAVFKIINEASPALKTMLKQVRDLTAAVEKAKVGLASLNKELLPSSGLTAAVAETDKLANAWRKVAAESGAARRAIGSATSASARAALPPSVGGGGGGGGRHQPGFMARGGGGAHVGGPLVPIPGGGHLRFGGAGAATAGLIGYGAYEAAQMEDAVWQLVYHSGVENNDANKAKFRKILQDGMRTSGYGVHDIAESAKQEIRMFQGTPGGGIDVLPEMLRAATIEARVKGESPEESMKALIGLAHMTKQYSPEAIKKLAPAFAFLSTANPGSLSSIERAAGYAVPLLQSGLEIDPMQSLLLGTALTRAGATSTKSGTWLREMALRAMPGTSLMSKMAYKKHEAALKEVGLSDDEGKPTWFTDGKPDLLKMLDIGGAGAAKIPLTRRAGIERSLFGAQGGGGFALLADPAVREQILALQKEMNSPEFKNRYGGFMESYNGQVTSQNARTALQYFNVTMQDIGQHTLPVVNHVLRDFKDTLAAVRGILPSKVISNGETIATRAAEGALAGGLIGAFTGPGAIVGAGAGGMLGAAEGFMETYGHGVGMDKGGSYSSPGKTGRPAQPIVVKPQPITLNLNVDGRALASAVTDAMGNQTGFSTQAPAADGLVYSVRATTITKITDHARHTDDLRGARRRHRRRPGSVLCRPGRRRGIAGSDARAHVDRADQFPHTDTNLRAMIDRFIDAILIRKHEIERNAIKIDRPKPRAWQLRRHLRPGSAGGAFKVARNPTGASPSRSGNILIAAMGRRNVGLPAPDVRAGGPAMRVMGMAYNARCSQTA